MCVDLGGTPQGVVPLNKSLELLGLKEHFENHVYLSTLARWSNIGAPRVWQHFPIPYNPNANLIGTALKTNNHRHDSCWKKNKQKKKDYKYYKDNISSTPLM